MTGYKMKRFYSFICLTRGFVLKLERIDLAFARQLDCQFGLHGAWVFSKQTLMQWVDFILSCQGFYVAVFMKRPKAVSISLFLTNSVLTCLLRGSRLDTHIFGSASDRLFFYMYFLSLQSYSPLIVSAFKISLSDFYIKLTASCHNTHARFFHNLPWRCRAL